MKFVLGRHPAAVMSLLPVLALAVACGGGGGHANVNSLPHAKTGTVSTGTPAPQGFDGNRCLQEHGIVLVTPGVQRPKDQTSAKLRAAMDACVKAQKKAEGKTRR